jgi:hypothetical protein
MSGSRKVQRSVRVTLATGMVAFAALAVVVAVATATWVEGAAVLAVLLGAVAVRVVYSEVTQTRRETARERAAQARSFTDHMSTTLADHAVFTSRMSARLAERDTTITELRGTVRLAEARADEAEQRVRREARRANDAQERLASLLVEVMTQRGAASDDDLDAELAELPTVVDLLSWDDAATDEHLAQLRRDA